MYFPQKSKRGIGVRRCKTNSGQEFALLKNDTQIPPGPVWVPIVLPMELIGSFSMCDSQRSALSFMYFWRSVSSNPVKPRQSGMEKSIPLHFEISSRHILHPFLEPRAFPRTATSPSTIAITGLMERRFPASAAVFEIRPPRFKYSKVSKRARTRTSFLR